MESKDERYQEIREYVGAYFPDWNNPGYTAPATMRRSALIRGELEEINLPRRKSGTAEMETLEFVKMVMEQTKEPEPFIVESR